MAILERDVNFLSTLKIMDYSMLVGIHNVGQVSSLVDQLRQLRDASWLMLHATISRSFLKQSIF